MIRNNVEIRSFEDCIKKVKYTKKVASQDFKESGRFPIVSQEEAFISGYWDNPDDVFSIDGPVVIFGDHSRHVKYVDFDFVIGADGVKILAPVDDINAKYFYYYLKSQRIQSLGYSRHYKVLKEKMVPVPSLADQQRIASQLAQVLFQNTDKFVRQLVHHIQPETVGAQLQPVGHHGILALYDVIHKYPFVRRKQDTNFHKAIKRLSYIPY